MRRRNLRESFSVGGGVVPSGTRKRAPRVERKATVEKPIVVKIEVPAVDPDSFVDEIREDLNLPPVPAPPDPAQKPRRTKRKKK